jgi:multidrug efflux pump subunit AcrB
LTARAQILNVSIVAIFETLAINLGSAYVNNYNTFGRSFQVRAQADQEFRLCEEDIAALCVCSATGLCSLWACLCQLSIQQVQRPSSAITNGSPYLFRVQPRQAYPQARRL